ncbi:MAG: YeeE/YedE family protein [Rhodomicrobium sp.]|nr:YeeE/YedE family protein [Rhodomicrobium sp.]
MSLSSKAWSPYLAGVIIGVLQIPAFLLIDTALGASSSYVTAAAYLASLVDPSILDPAATQFDYLQKHLTPGKNFWQVALVSGILLGALASALSSGSLRRAMSPIWEKAAGISSFPARAAMACMGGFVLLFGARLASGCTSGHGLSGMAQLAVSSTVAVGAMFAGGILVAMLMRRV